MACHRMHAHRLESRSQYATAGALSAVAVRYRREAMRRWGEHGGHASGKRLASCRQAWCRRAVKARASVQRMGSEAPRVGSGRGWSLMSAAVSQRQRQSRCCTVVARGLTLKAGVAGWSHPSSPSETGCRKDRRAAVWSLKKPSKELSLRLRPSGGGYCHCKEATAPSKR